MGVLDGRTRAIVVVESLARVIAAIRLIAFVGGHISPPNTELVLKRSCVRCAAIRIAIGAFIRVTCSFHVELRKGMRELTAFAEC